MNTEYWVALLVVVVGVILGEIKRRCDAAYEAERDRRRDCRGYTAIDYVFDAIERKRRPCSR